MEAMKLKMEADGPIEQWSKISVNLKSSRIRIRNRIEVESWIRK
jgi:hypothetical protein